ncbi:hypothetical protein DER44DRAFT_774393 [Fusarium oxysporum]|nr:hypothetical protein DER44DRAFT_774393 [Fusarium oxysporum]
MTHICKTCCLTLILSLSILCQASMQHKCSRYRPSHNAAHNHNLCLTTTASTLFLFSWASSLTLVFNHTHPIVPISGYTLT